MNAKAWIEQTLERLEMVSWDRFTESYDDGLGKFYTVYGWIDREKDDYKDFVVLRFFPDTDEHLISYTTSSDKYTHEIHRLLFDKGDGHNDCQRVEHTFDVSNVIELEETKQIMLSATEEQPND
ncbi:hypothetical protein [Natronosalvus caseinilyticus]|uniref:hypothetical protein n=1 Tax=Natronosalvus caseinilyticus TaxID=2953747 RepID=UPI0028B14589|nr:hypothetical protein [Natronosalvus caseinilyticus]